MGVPFVRLRHARGAALVCLRRSKRRRHVAVPTPQAAPGLASSRPSRTPLPFRSFSDGYVAAGGRPVQKTRVSCPRALNPPHPEEVAKRPSRRTKRARRPEKAPPSSC